MARSYQLLQHCTSIHVWEWAHTLTLLIDLERLLFTSFVCTVVIGCFREPDRSHMDERGPNVDINFVYFLGQECFSTRDHAEETDSSVGQRNNWHWSKQCWWSRTISGGCSQWRNMTRWAGFKAQQDWLWFQGIRMIFWFHRFFLSFFCLFFCVLSFRFERISP